MSFFEKHGKLHVEGASLKDCNGNVVQLRGISTHNISIYPEYINDEAFKQFAGEYSINIIRLAMYSAFADDINGYSDGDDKHRQELEDIICEGVRLCDKYGMYCIVDWHILFDYNPNFHKDMAIRFFKNICVKLKDYDNVIYEICNEPNMKDPGTDKQIKCTWEEISEYANTVIPVIREIDDSKVIIVGTPVWSQDVDTAADAPLNFYNVMYTLHFYADSHRDRIRDKLKYALAKNLPVFVTEFGMEDASGDGDINDEQTEIWLDLLDENKISYILWNLSNKDETSSILRPECQKLNNFDDSDLSPCGVRMKKMMVR